MKLMTFIIINFRFFDVLQDFISNISEAKVMTSTNLVSDPFVKQPNYFHFMHKSLKSSYSAREH